MVVNLENMSDPAANAWELLQSSWANAGYDPLTLNSAFRDEAHNKAVGGAKHSQHLQGNAYDMNTRGFDEAKRQELTRMALQSGFRGAGSYDNSMHFDTAKARIWGSDFSSKTAAPWLADIYSELGIDMGSTATGTKDKGKLSEFASEQGRKIADSGDSVEAMARDNRAFENASFGMMTGMMTPYQASQTMQASREQAQQQLAALNGKRDQVGILNEQAEQLDSPIPMMRPENLMAQQNMVAAQAQQTSPYNTEGGAPSQVNQPAPIVQSPKQVNGEEDKKGFFSKVFQEDPDDPWNWRVGIGDALSAVGVGLGQISVGKAANAQSVIARRNQVNQFRAQQERLKANADQAQSDLASGRAQAQSNWERTHGLKQYQAAQKAMSDTPTYTAAKFESQESRDALAADALKRGYTSERAKAITDDANVAAAYANSKDYWDKTTGSQAGFVPQDAMKAAAATARQQFTEASANMSDSERRSNEQAVTAMENAANSGDQDAYKAATENLSKGVESRVKENVAEQAHLNNVTAMQEKQRLQNEAPTGEMKEMAYYASPEGREALQKKMAITNASVLGNQVQTAKLGVVVKRVEHAEETYQKVRSLEPIHAELRSAIEAIGPDGTGPIHDKTLVLRKMAEEIGLGDFLPEGWGELGPEQRLQALNIATIRLERASGEGTMTEREGELMSLINGSLKNTYLGNLLLIQMKEGQAQYDKARSTAEINYFNQSATIDDMTNTEAKAAFMSDKGVGEYTSSVASLPSSLNSEQLGEALATFEEGAPNGHLIEFTVGGATFFYQKGGVTFDDKGNPIETGGTNE